jgi:hypothetical protein
LVHGNRLLVVGAVSRTPRAAVGLENFLPALVDRLAIVQIQLIYLVFEPAVDN